MTAAAIAALAATTNPLVAAGTLALVGVAAGVWAVTDATLWQTLVPNHLLGRVTAVLVAVLGRRLVTTPTGAARSDPGGDMTATRAGRVWSHHRRT